MSWTKRQLIEGALEEIGLASFEFDIDSSELASALKRLDAMMADWNIQGIRIGFPLYANPDNSTLAEDSGVPDYAVRAIVQNLALEIAPSYGRQPSRETKVGAKEGKTTLLRQAGVFKPEQKQFPKTFPRGAGQKTHRGRRDPFFNEPTDQLRAGPDSLLDLD